MSTSQNGWAVDQSGSAEDRGEIFPGVKVPNGVRAGDVAVVFRWLARQYNARVERLKPGSCWGWYVKTIEGSKTISNHASGTAIDLNADDHPMGDPTRNTFTAAKIAACRAIVDESAGVLRWGGDYTGRPDSMHWEIVGSSSAVARLADRIRSEQEEDDVTQDDIDKVAAAVVTALTKRTALNGPDGKPDGTYSTPLGASVLAQGVPDGTDPDGARVTVWQELQHIAQRVAPAGGGAAGTTKATL